MNTKQAIDILETMTAEPDEGHEARLDADELDAVLYAVKILKGEEIPSGAWQYEPPCDYARRFNKWLYTNGGNYKCMNCNNYALHKSNYCPNCGALMEKEATT